MPARLQGTDADHRTALPDRRTDVRPSCFVRADGYLRACVRACVQRIDIAMMRPGTPACSRSCRCHVPARTRESDRARVHSECCTHARTPARTPALARIPRAYAAHSIRTGRVRKRHQVICSETRCARISSCFCLHEGQCPRCLLQLCIFPSQLLLLSRRRRHRHYSPFLPLPR